MAMFRAYFDESGTHDESRAVCLGGYVSTVAAWDRLEIEWNVMLANENLEILHRVDLENFRKEFKDWDDKRRKRLLVKATRLIRAYTMKGLFGAVFKKDFERTMPECVQRAFGGPYGWLVHDAMIGIGHWGEDRGQTAPVEYVFEEGAHGRKQVERMFKTLGKDKHWGAKLLLGGWSFAKKENVVQLQTADILVYEVYKHVTNRIVDGERREIRKSVKRLIRRTDEGYYWDGRRLLRWLERNQASVESLQRRERTLQASGRERLI